MVGLDAAGKTTILYKLKLGEVVTTIPTIGEYHVARNATLSCARVFVYGNAIGATPPFLVSSFFFRFLIDKTSLFQTQR